MSSRVAQVVTNRIHIYDSSMRFGRELEVLIADPFFWEHWRNSQ